MININQTIISQYGNSPTILELIRNFDAYVDPRADIDGIFQNIWDIQTAKGFGLDMWGRVVNISREVRIPLNQQYFGFNEAGNSAYPFGQGTFYDRSNIATQAKRLTDAAYRQLIMIKALVNISATDARSLNALFQSLFAGKGRVYVSDYGNMTMRYMFEFELTPSEFAILTQSGILLKPAGVKVYFYQEHGKIFGFKTLRNSWYPFGEGTFREEQNYHAII